MNPMSLIIRMPTVFQQVGGSVEWTAAEAVSAANSLKRPVFAADNDGVVVTRMV